MWRKITLTLCMVVGMFVASAAIVPATVEGTAPAERVVCNEDGCTTGVWWSMYAWWCGDDPWDNNTRHCVCYEHGADMPGGDDCQINSTSYDGAGTVWCTVGGYNCERCVDNESPEQHAAHAKPQPEIDWTLAR